MRSAAGTIGRPDTGSTCVSPAARRLPRSCPPRSTAPQATPGRPQAGAAPPAAAAAHRPRTLPHPCRRGRPPRQCCLAQPGPHLRPGGLLSPPTAAAAGARGPEGGGSAGAPVPALCWRPGKRQSRAKKGACVSACRRAWVCVSSGVLEIPVRMAVNKAEVGGNAHRTYSACKDLQH